jgi:sortase A
VIAAAITATALALGAPAAPPAAGAPFATIAIPAIGVHALVREGVSADVLADGPGHYPGTSLPGRGGTIGIAGHRVTHTRPFLRINQLRRGQRIVLTRRSHRFVYRISAMRIVAPTEVWPVRRRPKVETLALTACHPPRTDVRRLVVFAELVTP